MSRTQTSPPTIRMSPSLWGQQICASQVHYRKTIFRNVEFERYMFIFLCKSLTTHVLFNVNDNNINNNVTKNNDSNDEMSVCIYHASTAVASFCKPLTTFHMRVESSGVAYPLVAHLILPFLSRI